MKSSYIAVLDSGIGGLSVLKALVKEFPSEKFLYLGDNDNAPYGNKSKHQLLNITYKNIRLIERFPIKALVLACNTLSTNLMLDIKKVCSVPVFGIFPPINECRIKGEKTLLLSTVNTAKTFKKCETCDVVGLTTLARDIELVAPEFDKLDVIDVIYKQKQGDFVSKKGYYDTLILGCTHYEFVKNQIVDHFCPKKIISGTNTMVKKLKNFLSNQKSLANYSKKQVLFIGNNSKFNEKIFLLSGQI